MNHTYDVCQFKGSFYNLRESQLMRYKTEKIHNYKETADSRVCDIVSLNDHVNAVDAVLFKSLWVRYKSALTLNCFFL